MVRSTPVLTKHQQRSAQVRSRCQRVVRKLTVPNGRRGGFTVYGVFAERVWQLANEHDIEVSNQKDRSTAGIPKDLAHSFHCFIDGKRIGTEKMLDVYAMTCHSFEQQFKAERAAAREAEEAAAREAEAHLAGRGQLDQATVPTSVFSHPPRLPVLAGQAVDRESLELTEFQAADKVAGLLSSFNTPTAKRILSYVSIALDARGDANGA